MPATSVSSAAAEGSRRDLLVATRDRIAVAVDDSDTPARDLAALTRRLMDITEAIEAIDLAESEDEQDAPTPDEEFDPEAL